jgi:endonuclease III
MAKRDIVARLLDRHGRTHADECGIRVRGGGDDLFQLLLMALLMSARISTDIAVRATRALLAHGWTDARAMADASWQGRVDALGEGGYVRYDESTSRYLGETSELLLDRYGGDLRRLRDEADRAPEELRRRLKACKGIGDVGTDIFFREVQGVWPELHPFLGRRELEVADRLGLGDRPATVGRLVPDGELPRLAAALLRARLADEVEALRDGDDLGALSATQVDTMTKDELLAHAREVDLSGRSSMTRDELASALA